MNAKKQRRWQKFLQGAGPFHPPEERGGGSGTGVQMSMCPKMKIGSHFVAIFDSTRVGTPRRQGYCSHFDSSPFWESSDSRGYAAIGISSSYRRPKDGKGHASDTSSPQDWEGRGHAATLIPPRSRALRWQWVCSPFVSFWLWGPHYSRGYVACSHFVSSLVWGP